MQGATREGDAKSSFGDSKSSFGDSKSSLVMRWGCGLRREEGHEMGWSWGFGVGLKHLYNYLGKNKIV
jgi:hypothetical protein